MAMPKTKEEILEFAVELEQCAAGLDDIICRTQNAISYLLDDSTRLESIMKEFHNDDIKTLCKCRDFWEKTAKGSGKYFMIWRRGIIQHPLNHQAML